MLKIERKAFTVIELVFVIVIIGILSAVAIPKFAGIRGDAVESKAATTLASVRSALATERQKRILKSLFDPITSLHADGSTTRMFTTFSDTTDLANSIPASRREVLGYSVARGANEGEWDVDATGSIYTAYFMNSRSCSFVLANSRLSLTTSSANMPLAQCQQVFDN